MRHMRTHMPALSLYVGLFMACLVLTAAPACTKNQRVKTIHASLVSVNAARDGFVTWDREHQLEIVAKSTSREEVERELAGYRSKRTPLVDSFEVAYRALAVAATQTDDLSLKRALEASAALLDAIKKLRGGS